MSAQAIFSVSSWWPAAALARPHDVGQGTEGSFVWYFGLAVIAALMLLWFWRSMSEHGPPPLDPRNRP